MCWWMCCVQYSGTRISLEMACVGDSVSVCVCVCLFIVYLFLSVLLIQLHEKDCIFQVRKTQKTCWFRLTQDGIAFSMAVCMAAELERVVCKRSSAMSSIRCRHHFRLPIVTVHGGTLQNDANDVPFDRLMQCHENYCDAVALPLDAYIHAV